MNFSLEWDRDMPGTQLVQASIWWREIDHAAQSTWDTSVLLSLLLATNAGSQLSSCWERTPTLWDLLVKKTLAHRSSAS